jgi:hypothetical protein
MHTLRKNALLAAAMVLCQGAVQAGVTLEIHQDQTTYNLRSVSGVPISATVNNPPGSNGRMPTGVNESGSLNETTAGQFMGLLTIGGSTGLAQSQWQAASNSTVLSVGSTAFSGSVAEEMQLPIGRSGEARILILRRAQIGAPFLNRPASFLFGSVIPVADTDENGILLTNIVKESYWQAQPFGSSNDTAYYWSPNAQQVYATQPGPVNITWIKAAPYTAATVPTNYSDSQYGTVSFYTNGSSIYLLHTVPYIVAASPVKTPRKIFWNQKSFQNIGKLVTIPTALVRDIKIVYNNTFPVTSTAEYTPSGYVDPTAGTSYEGQGQKEMRTLWYNNGSINAYNIEGRVFVELLGDVRADKTQVQLGYEIVDVAMQATPQDVTVELGERLPPPAPGSWATLSPEPLNQLVISTTTYGYQHAVVGSDDIELYAAAVTSNLNDYQVFWMEAGEVGIKWPAVLARYKLIWPTDIAKYSHYVRPVVSSEAEAMETAVALTSSDVPAIQYQDPLDVPRAKLTSDPKFYTYLDADHPVHRTLIRYIVGDYIAFERVYSWLDTTLKTGNFANTAATNLTSWDPNTSTMTWPDTFSAPRVVSSTANVGDRVSAPDGELGSSTNYVAGHINTSAGTLFNPGAYIDPLASGFESAALGAIIPVNAVPGRNQLEVWWFRQNNAHAGPNIANAVKGFHTSYWPSVIGRYTIQYPPAAAEIVLASKLGARLDTLQAKGTVYRQNDTNEFGYNPNEEHAIISGGSVYATRDDLNLTNSADYSSAAAVLVNYQGEDGRPAMTVFKVVRERPDLGYVFDYIVPAGQLLQAPMPLPLLAKPVEGTGVAKVNYNTEPPKTGGDLPGNWNATRDSGGLYGCYSSFTYRDRNQDFWVYRGPHAGIPALQAGTCNPVSSQFTAAANATAIIGQPFVYTMHASRQSEYLATTLSAPGLSWLSIAGLVLRGTPAGGTGDFPVTVVVTDPYEGSSVTNTFQIQVLTSGAMVAQGPLVIASTNSATGSIVNFSNRPPFLAASPVPSNSFTMRFYYKTDANFDWPGMANPPAVGSIVPYLRPWNSTNQVFEGEASSKLTTSLEIVYRPVWPEAQADGTSIPVMQYAYTLTEPRFGLPGVRSMKTARVLYQQSVAADMVKATPSVLLLDPTRQKIADLSSNGLTQLPTGIYAQTYQGKTYFPNLPPHLASRLYYDPDRGTKGSLVLKGTFNQQSDLEHYLLLNVLRGADKADVLALCPTSDADYGKWANTVNALATAVETFWENPLVPGSYVANPNLTVSVNVGSLTEVNSDETAVDSYALSASGPGQGYVILVENGGSAKTESGDSVALHILKVGGGLYSGALKAIASENPLSEKLTFQHSVDVGGRYSEYEYEWKIASPVNGVPPTKDATMSQYLSLVSGTDLPRYVLGGAGVRALGDNYVVMRYRPVNPNHPLYVANPTDADWSSWTTPILAEGWIKRVLAGINPFNQRTTDLYNNSVNTDVSMLTQAGTRWEGAVALNQDTINDYGLIAIYETVLRRGRALSIDAGYNYGPANDALLLAAGYLGDLYTMEGNEAWADASNPTIGIGTKDKTYGDIATSMFSFEGQVSTLLEEELALLRGRDDFLQPGVETAPVYNRLVWNYTRGIDSGEVIYAINYNIQPAPDNTTSALGAADAAYMYPQGHGDAYGHYLTALKGYYSLLLNSCFDWVPKSEAVTVLGMPVQVNYQHERKFAAAAAAVARAGLQVFDLTWRRDFQPVHQVGWSQFEAAYLNTQRSVTSTNCWGLDHWASRTGQGVYLNWVVGNALLPDVDPDSTHTGIQKVDRTTVTELLELPVLSANLQTDMDNAEGGVSPLGVPQDGIAFDIDPNAVLGASSQTHFEQVYQRALVALNNAVTAFDGAKDVTALMRSEQDSLTEFQASVASQELAYTNALIELYGTPYTDDIGAGKTYVQDYAGPDMVHYNYVEIPESTFGGLLTPTVAQTNYIDIQQLPSDWGTTMYNNVDFIVASSAGSYTVSNSIQFILGPHGFFDKPSSWTGSRQSPGKIQQAISDLIKAHDKVAQALSDAESAKTDLDKAINAFKAQAAIEDWITALGISNIELETAMMAENTVYSIGDKVAQDLISILGDVKQSLVDSLPGEAIFGLAAGGDLGKLANVAVYTGFLAAKAGISAADTIAYTALQVSLAAEQGAIYLDEKAIAKMQNAENLQNAVYSLGQAFEALSGNLTVINQQLRAYDDAQRNYQAMVAEGDRIQSERQSFRQRAAQVIQGYRTRDAGFRIFRNEKLERYKTLFDLAARYSLLAANAYDYETGLLNTDAGRAFVNRIINSRALGVITDGQPQYAGSDTGDPGLSSALAEMKADWDVLRGRLGFNNPDAYGTTFSLRTENLRILPGADGDSTWQDVLQNARKDNLLDDSDVLRYCMQADVGDGLPVPGIVLTFSTTIADGCNLFGHALAAGDHAFSPSSFATKIFAVGVALEGYRGMDDPSGSSSGSASQDSLALAATPYIYLIPVGADSMRTPPLGDTSTIRTWTVEDVAIPMPFNIGSSDYSSKQLWQSADSLSEPLFATRKHQAFRPVSAVSLFTPDLYTSNGSLQRSQFTNNRLIGRSVWNSKWKLVIPGRTLLDDPKEGLNRFLQTVSDIKLHFVTYSYAGN